MLHRNPGLVTLQKILLSPDLAEEPSWMVWGPQTNCESCSEGGKLLAEHVAGGSSRQKTASLLAATSGPSLYIISHFSPSQCLNRGKQKNAWKVDGKSPGVRLVTTWLEMLVAALLSGTHILETNLCVGFLFFLVMSQPDFFLEWQVAHLRRK